MGSGDSTAQTDSSNDEVSPQPTSFPPVDNHGAVPKGGTKISNSSRHPASGHGADRIDQNVDS